MFWDKTGQMERITQKLFVFIFSFSGADTSFFVYDIIVRHCLLHVSACALVIFCSKHICLGSVCNNDRYLYNFWSFQCTIVLSGITNVIEI